VHQYGQRARSLLRDARESIAAFCGCDQNAEIVFTSGGTESCSHMIYGFLGEVASLSLNPRHIVSSTIEHPAVFEPIKALTLCGWQASWINPQADGFVRAQSYLDALRPETALVVLLLANNESGALQPVLETARLLRDRGYRGAIVSDSTQAFGKAAVDVGQLFTAGVNALSLSGHKLGAPGGIGALIVNRSLGAIAPFLLGGHQQAGMRAGTENVAAAAALGAVAKQLTTNLRAEIERKRSLRNMLWEEIKRELPDVLTFSPHRGAALLDHSILDNTLLLRFPGCRADDLVVALDLAGLAVSSGSACSSGKQSPSHVLLAMGHSPEEAQEAIRLSIDWGTSEQQVRQAVRLLAMAVRRMRNV
jgi:cysteine desulfurase